MKYFCITENIAYYLQKYIVYRKRKIFYGKSKFQDLIDLIVKHREDNFLIPLPKAHNAEIPDILDKNKIKYTIGTFYRTISNQFDDAKDFDYDILVFYLSLIHIFRIADSLNKLKPVAKKTEVVISDTTSVCSRNSIADFTFYDSSGLFRDIDNSRPVFYPFSKISKLSESYTEQPAGISGYLRDGNLLPSLSLIHILIGWIWDVERDNVQMHVRHIFQKFSSTPFVHFAK